MSIYKGNIHVRVSRIQQEKLRELSEHYNTSKLQHVWQFASQEKRLAFSSVTTNSKVKPRFDSMVRAFL